MHLRNVILMYLAKNKQATGYDIAVFLKGKTKNSHQQVYRELSRLECDTLITHTLIPQSGRPDKKVFKLTRSSSCTPPKFCKSDFTKTKLAYGLLIHDIKNGTNEFDRYQDVMQKAEQQFLFD